MRTLSPLSISLTFVLIVRRNANANIRRPWLFKLGGLVLGGLIGLQIGLFRMRTKYGEIDADGSLRARLDALFQAARGKGPLPVDEQEQTEFTSDQFK